MGDQTNLKIAPFEIPGKKGFITYNLSPEGNYFDCDVFDEQGNLFKVYIKDIYSELDLQNVLAIISTVEKYQ